MGIAAPNNNTLPPPKADARLRAQRCSILHVVTCDTKKRQQALDVLQAQPHSHSQSQSQSQSQSPSQSQAQRSDGHSRQGLHFAAPVNVCANETKWRGFGWRLKKYMAHLLTLVVDEPAHGHQQEEHQPQQRGAGPCQPLVALVDGADVLVNHLRPHEVQRRWQQLGADVLVATEMTCWLGRFCRDEDVRRYYHGAAAPNSSSSSSPSAYVNSALMGDARALSEVLTAACTKLVNCTDGVDDQLVMTMIASQPPGGAGALGNWTVKRDVQQRIFGSMVYSQHDAAACPRERQFEFLPSCYDVLQRRHVFENCCSNHDLGMKLQQRIFQLVGEAGYSGGGGGGATGDHKCDIVRVPGLGLGPAMSGAAAADATAQFYGKPLAQLEAHPLFWHGNGPSKPIFIHMSKRVAECRRREKPPRLVVSVSTFPGRMSQLEKMLRSLAAQSLLPDAIYIHIPFNVTRFSPPLPPFDEAALQNETSRLQSLFAAAAAAPAAAAQPALIIKRGVDYGPATKLLGALLHETDPSTRIICCDDDTVYHRDLVKTLVDGHREHPRNPIATHCEAVVSLEGQGLWPVVKGPFNQLCRGWACAFAGVLFTVGMFDSSVFTQLQAAPPGCRVHDDVFISGYLLRQRGLRPMLVAPPHRVKHLAANHENAPNEEQFAIGGVDNVRLLQKQCILYFGNFTS